MYMYICTVLTRSYAPFTVKPPPSLSAKFQYRVNISLLHANPPCAPQATSPPEVRCRWPLQEHQRDPYVNMCGLNGVCNPAHSLLGFNIHPRAKILSPQRKTVPFKYMATQQKRHVYCSNATHIQYIMYMYNTGSNIPKVSVHRIAYR